MDRWKAEQGRGREKRKIRRKIRRERVRRKQMQMREKVGKSRNTVFSQWFGAPEGRKVGSLKRRVRSRWPDERWTVARRCGAKHISKSKCTKHLSAGPLVEVAMSKKCTPLWRKAHLEVKMLKTPGVRTTFGSCDVEKVHAAVARSTCRSQNVQDTPFSDHLTVEMSKKCTPLWREAHFEVKMYKTHHSRTTFDSWDVEKVHAVVARSTFPSQNVQKTRGSDHFGSCDVEKVHAAVARSTFRSQNEKKTRGVGPLLEVQVSLRFASLQYTTWHYTTLHHTTLHYTTLHNTTTTTTTTTQLHSTTLHYTKLHYTTLHSNTVHYITLHYTTFHYTWLHLTTLHYITLHYTTLHYTTLHYTTTTTAQLHSTTLHYTTLHYLPLHLTTLQHITLHYTPLHYNYNYTTTLHYTPLHYKKH